MAAKSGPAAPVKTAEAFARTFTLDTEVMCKTYKEMWFLQLLINVDTAKQSIWFVTWTFVSFSSMLKLIINVIIHVLAMQRSVLMQRHFGPGQIKHFIVDVVFKDNLLL